MLDKRATSIASLVTLAVLAVTTVLLGSAGVITYESYRAEQWTRLHERHRALANQLAVGLALPLWNFDRHTLAKVMDGALQANVVSGVSVHTSDDHSLVDARARDARWRSVVLHADPTPEGAIVEERSIVFDGETIGSVRVLATSRFVDERLATAKLWIVYAIAGFDAAMVLCLYALLSFLVLKPLRSVEKYAHAVSSGERELADRAQGPSALRGELASLQDSLVRMIERLRDMNASLEQRVSERTAQLAASNKELQSFSYSVSHDLRSPLRGIDGWSQALLEDCGDKLDDTGREYMARVRTEAQRMGQLIDDMLRFSKVTQTELDLREVDVSAMAREILHRLHEREPQRRVTCEVQEGMTVRADATLLDAALTNLLDNAWKFTSKRAEAQIDFGSDLENGVRVFHVRDDGAGFDMSTANSLFAPFQRMHRAKDFPGTGVGLATVQRIVQRHGGTIWAQSAVNQGTTLYFTLEHRS